MDLLLLTERGMVQRIPAAGIRETGRAAQGVRLIQLEPEDRLTTLARVPQIEDEGKGPEEGDALEPGTSPEAPSEPDAPPPADEPIV
jgi:DNA gyrase subunit A